jgi:hypothetical protein
MVPKELHGYKVNGVTAFATSTQSIEVVGEVVTIALNRFAEGGMPVTDPITAELEIVVPVGRKNVGITNVNFRLRAVVAHARGHYEALVRKTKEEWFVISDDTIEIVSGPKALNRAAVFGSRFVYAEADAEATTFGELPDE